MGHTILLIPPPPAKDGATDMPEIAATTVKDKTIFFINTS